jgi:DNA-binding transcriptional LysR family regulator
MKFSHLAILDAIVDTKSLKQAAERCHKTQPALTMAMRKLEQNIGFTLIDRSGYRLKLTPAGERFYQQAKRILTSCEELNKVSDTLALGYEPKISIAYEQLASDSMINQLIGQVIKSYPSTQFDIYGGSRFQAIEKLAKGEIDIGIGPWFDIFHTSGDFQSIKLKPLEIILVCAPSLLSCQNSHLNSHLNSYLKSEELNSLPCLTLKPTELPFDGDRLSFARGSQVIVVEELVTLRAMLIQGVGWGLAAKELCQSELDSGVLKQIKLSDGQDSFQTELRAFRRNANQYGPVANTIWQGLENLYQ